MNEPVHVFQCNAFEFVDQVELKAALDAMEGLSHVSISVQRDPP